MRTTHRAGLEQLARESGLSVGIVSHVPELRQRIPAQVVVTKSETGSSVRLRGVQGAAEVA